MGVCDNLWHVEIVDRVKVERQLRGWSVRAAAAHGQCSNTTWGTYEASGKVTAKVRTAVALAFDWPGGWPENPPPVAPIDDERIAAIEREVAELRAVVEQLAQEVQRMTRPPVRRSTRAAGP